MDDDPTKAIVLSQATLDDAVKMLDDPQVSEETKRQIVGELFLMMLMEAGVMENDPNSPDTETAQQVSPPGRFGRRDR